MPELDTLSKNLKHFRQIHRESQRTYAEHTGVCMEEVSLMERRLTDPKLSTLQKIAAYEGITVSALLQVVDEVQNHEADDKEQYQYEVLHIETPVFPQAAYGIIGRKREEGGWHTMAVAAPFSNDYAEVLRLAETCTALRLSPLQLLDVVVDFLNK